MLNLTDAPRKILIIKPSALGDIVHTLPVLQALKTCYPEVEIHWVVVKGLHTFLEGHPLIHRLWIFDRQKWKSFSALSSTLKEIRQFVHGLRAERFDVSLDFSGLLRSGLITWMAGARIRLGFSNGDEGSFLFYNRAIDGDMSIHAVVHIKTFYNPKSNNFDPFQNFFGNPFNQQRQPQEASGSGVIITDDG